jgi:hypothetical protein
MLVDEVGLVGRLMCMLSNSLLFWNNLRIVSFMPRTVGVYRFVSLIRLKIDASISGIVLRSSGR